MENGEARSEKTTGEASPQTKRPPKIQSTRKGIKKKASPKNTGANSQRELEKLRRGQQINIMNMIL